MRFELNPLFRVAIVLAFLSLTAIAQTSNFHADTQIWPELTFGLRVRPGTAIQFYGTVREGRDVTAVVNKQIGVGINHSFNKYFSTFAGYRYVVTNPIPNKHSNEHRYFFDVTGRLPLSHKFLLSNRARAEFRDINGTFSRRYRDRVQVERDFSIKDHRFTPYISGEAFYDDRYHILNRHQYYLGWRMPLGKHLTLDNYFLRLLDKRGTPGRLSIIGVHFKFDY